MAKRGKHGYFTKDLAEELRDVMREDGLQKPSEAQSKLVKYAQVGRELNRLRQLDYDWSKKKKTKRQKKKGGVWF